MTVRSVSLLGGGPTNVRGRRTAAEEKSSPPLSPGLKAAKTEELEEPATAKCWMSANGQRSKLTMNSSSRVAGSSTEAGLITATATSPGAAASDSTGAGVVTATAMSLDAANPAGSSCRLDAGSSLAACLLARFFSSRVVRFQRVRFHNATYGSKARRTAQRARLTPNKRRANTSLDSDYKGEAGQLCCQSPASREPWTWFRVRYSERK